MRAPAFLIAAFLSSAALGNDEQAAQKHLLDVQARTKVERRDYGDDGSIFKVWISPPEKPSFDPQKFEGLSPFAKAVDVPCKEVEIGLNSYGPTGSKDLSLTLGIHRVEDTGAIFLEFHLPKSHSGHAKGLPFLVLICSKVSTTDGKVIDWIPTPLKLMDPEDLKKQEKKQ